MHENYKEKPKLELTNEWFKTYWEHPTDNINDSMRVTCKRFKHPYAVSRYRIFRENFVPYCLRVSATILIVIAILWFLVTL